MIPRQAVALIAVAAALSGCSRADAPEGEVDGGLEVACALDGAETFADACTVERRTEGGRTFLIVRRPDGGFRRLEVVADGAGILAADGADPAAVELVDGMLDVSVGKDHYLLPAALRNPAEPDAPETPESNAPQP